MMKTTDANVVCSITTTSKAHVNNGDAYGPSVCTADTIAQLAPHTHRLELALAEQRPCTPPPARSPTTSPTPPRTPDGPAPCPPTPGAMTPAPATARSSTSPSPCCARSSPRPSLTPSPVPPHPRTVGMVHAHHHRATTHNHDPRRTPAIGPPSSPTRPRRVLRVLRYRPANPACAP
jgi:hypothetical protein